MRRSSGVVAAVARARWYFAAQAAAGAIWWISVFVSGDVRRLTLGGWDPWLLVGPDVAFFVLGSLWAALTGSRTASVVVTVWTIVVTASLLVYGLIERSAGWGVVAMTVAAFGTAVSALTVWHGRLPTEWLFVGPFAFRPATVSSRATHVRRSLAQLVVFWTLFFAVVPLIVAAAEHRLRVSLPALQHPAGIGSVG